MLNYHWFNIFMLAIFVKLLRCIMKRYADLAPFLSNRDNFRFDHHYNHSVENIEHFRVAYPGVPEDYLDFLAECGSGVFMNGRFEIFNEFKTPAIEKNGTLLNSDYEGETIHVFAQIGDHYAAFMPQRNWAIYIAFDAFSDMGLGTEKNFEGYIRFIIEYCRGEFLHRSAV